MEQNASILVVASPTRGEALRRALAQDGFDVEVTSGDEAAVLLDRGEFDAVVADGEQRAERLRMTPSRPRLIVSSGDELERLVEGLDADVEDFVVEPFKLRELRARLHALLRRSSPAAGEMLRYTDLVLDTSRRTAMRGGAPIDLTKTEFDLLELFLRNPRHVLTREYLFERVWGYDPEYSSNSLSVYIRWLRRKTEVGGRPRLIRTIRGVGYVLRA